MIGLVSAIDKRLGLLIGCPICMMLAKDWSGAKITKNWRVQMGSIFTEKQESYLKNHKLAVLATGRQDGSPQISLIAYHWDGADIIIAPRRHSAKWKNALRQPNLALLVQDGPKQLIVYGQAEGIDEEPLRTELATRLWTSVFDDPDQVTSYIQKQRPILRITPNKAFDTHV